MKRNTALTDAEKAAICEAYERGLSMKAVANSLGVSVGVVHKTLAALGCNRSPSESHIGIRHTLEVIERIRKANTGRHMSDETKKKISEARKLHGMGYRRHRADGYISIHFPDYPSSNSEGYVFEHRLVMEQHIGRPLKPDEVVHHINHDRADNRIENLALMTASEHMSMHMRERHAERRKIKSTS